MKFNDAREVDQLCYQMKLADYPRAQNRARINDLMNGVPPYSEQEVQENNIAVNVNYLEGTRITHDARSQFYQAFLKPGNYFKATTDMGPVHKRGERSAIVTKEVNKIMKRSLRYYECFRSKFAMDVLHGIGISGWEDRDHWCPDPMGIEDVMIPANTLLTMKNLPFTALYRSYTAPELIKLTRSDKNPGWNKKMVQRCLEWIDKETMSLMGSNWPEVWSPEKMSERVKGDGGFYVGDQVPTIDVWDLRFWDDDKQTSGWKRRMVLDAWSTPEGTGGAYTMNRRSGELYNRESSDFLFDSGNRKEADNLSEIITFQFADLSSVAPFRYHSVRSLGFLLYAVCHLQNRLRCKFSESVFESLMMYFRVKTLDDVQRTLKLDMINKGFIDDSIQFVPAADRFQINESLVQLGLGENANLIQQHSSSYTTNQQKAPDKVEKTKFEVMAEVNAATSLVSAALMQAYQYQVFEYREIFRRMCRANSRDVDVLKFRANCLRQGVPASLLNPEAWDLEPERVMGSGNKTLEMAIAQQLMQYRNLYDPEPQRDILRDVTLAITDDPARAESLVPEKAATITDSVHDAQLAAGVLLQGLPVAIKTGMNHIEYVETLLADMAIIVQKGAQSGGMLPMDKITGLQNMAQHIAQHIQIIGQDKEEKQRVKQYGDQLGKLMNMVKAFAQRLQEQQQKQNGAGPQMDPKDAAKIQGQVLMSKVKADNTAKSHAQRTAQRELQWEMEQKRKAADHQQQMQIESQKAALEITKERMKSLNDEKE